MVHIKTFHLFAGAGGGILGDLLLGHEPIGAVEIEKYPREVLLARQRDGILPLFPIWDDVTTFRADNPKTSAFIERLKAEENLCICGGFPCQDISSAGKGAGIAEGTRSGLWFEMSRIIGEIRPSYVFIENSPNLTFRGGTRVIADLAELGYDAKWGVIGADSVGALHKRERCWIMAYSSEFRVERQRKSFKNCEISRYESIKCNQAFCKEDRITTKTNGVRDVNGLAYRVDRIKAIGNGQVPQVVKLAWEILGGEM